MSGRAVFDADPNYSRDPLRGNKAFLSPPPRDLLFGLSRAILFEMDPEKAHDLTLQMLSKPAVQSRLASRYATATVPTEELGQDFRNRIALAAVAKIGPAKETGKVAFGEAALMTFELYVSQLRSKGQLVLFLIARNGVAGTDSCRAIPEHVLMPSFGQHFRRASLRATGIQIVQILHHGIVA